MKDIRVGKYLIDPFYIFAISTCFILYLVLPDKAHDVLVATIIVTLLGVADTLASTEREE